MGMHRSGTSALTGALHQAGVYLGDAIVPPSHDNPRGFYENYKIQEFNDHLLGLLHSTWDDVKPLPDQWWQRSEVLALHNEAAKIIKKQYGRQALFAIKDPRFSLLLPFWRDIMGSLGIVTMSVITLRHPQEIVASLERRNHFSQEKSRLLIGKYLLSAIRDSHTHPMIITTYDALLHAPSTEVRRILEASEAPYSWTDVGATQIDRYVSGQFRSFDQTASDPNIAKALYDVEALYSYILQAEYSLEKKTNHHEASLWIQYQEAFERYQKIEEKTSHFAKLILDCGEGYQERLSQQQSIILGDQDLYFDLDFAPAPIRGIKLFPANAKCVVELMEVHIDGFGEETPYILRNNASRIEDQRLHFDNDFPQIILAFHTPRDFSSIRFKLKIWALGRSELLQRPSQVANKKEGKWKILLSTLLNHPTRVVRNINFQNIRTLRSALKRESPRQIIRNFKKLIEQPEYQQAVQQKSHEAQEAFFKNKNPHNPKATEETQAGTLRSSWERDVVGLSILYIVPRIPEMDTSSGGKRATRILRLLAERHRVSICVTGVIEEGYRKQFVDHGISVVNLHELKHRRASDDCYHVLIFAWYYTWEEAKVLRQRYPAARTIIDSVDVHWVREQRALATDDHFDAASVARNKQREIAAYQHSDIVWVVSEPDKEAIHKEIASCDVRIVSNIHQSIIDKYTAPQDYNLLFLGNYGHHPNVSTATYLATTLLPAVRQNYPAAHLLLAGSQAPPEIVQLGDLEGVSFLGYIKETDLSTLYAESFLCLAPLTSGAGIKGKICEAIAHSVPVLTNSIGNEGIGLEHEASGLIADNEADLITIIGKAISGSYDMASITQQAQLRISTIVGQDIVMQHAQASFYRPIDICIVTYNGLNYLNNCITSIMSHTVYPNYNILIYSNGCEDGSVDYIHQLEKDHSNIIGIYSPTNDVFVRPNNRMMDLHPRHDVLLLNNDVQVTPAWLMGMYKTAYSQHEVGIVGAKLLNPDGSLQEYGAEIYADGSGMNYGRDDDAEASEYAVVKAVPYASGCALYIKRSTIEILGVLDDRFHPCYFEDSDYCYRAWMRGLGTVVTPSSKVIHYEGATAGTTEDEGFKRYQKINRQYFLSKHASSCKEIRKKVRSMNQKLGRGTTS